MLSIIDSGKTWNPHCRRGEATKTDSTLRRKDLWFFMGLMLFLVLLFFIWQQNRGLRLAAEVARLEQGRDALRQKVLEHAVAVAELRQPEVLLADAGAGDLTALDLASRVFVRGGPRRGERRAARDTWLASVGLGVSQAFAAESP